MYVRPDGGWGWIVAMATFLTNVIVDGVKYSFGIIFVELVETFKRSKSETSWIMSIQIGVMLLSGPIVAALVNRFGCRKIALAGTVISFTGFLASSFVKSLYVMYATFGLLGGFGFGMMTMPAMVTLARYFDKRLALASGIAAMGSGFGTLVFNPLSKILIDLYTWRGTLLIEAGIVLNGLICALVMKQPKFTPENINASLESNTDIDNDLASFTDLKSKHYGLCGCPVAEQELGVVQNNKSAVPEQNIDHEANSDSAMLEKESEAEMSLLSKENDVKQIVDKDPYTTFIDKDINGEIQTENYCKTSCLAISISRNKNRDSKMLNSTEPYIQANDKLDSSVKRKSHENTKKSRWFSLSPLKNVGFLFFLVSGFLIEIALNVPFTFLPDMMLRKGFPKQDAVWMLFVIGLVSTISRIVIGFVADLRLVNRVKLCNSIVVLNGIFVVFCPFCFNYASFLAFAILFGFSAGSSSSLRYVLVPDLFGVDMIADLYGINMFFCAFAAFIGLPKAGALFDVTGHYTVPFVVAGAELAVSGLLLFLIPVIQRTCMVPTPRALKRTT